VSSHSEGRQWRALPSRWTSAKGEKGSIYSRNSDGTVTRTKTAELQAEQAKRGINQDQSMTMHNTRFVHPDHHQGLIYSQMGKTIVQNGVIHKAVPLGPGKGLGSEPIPDEHISSHPKVGWIPVEWNNPDEQGKQMTHLGHPIVEVN